jgi:hypothetical protein
VQLKGVEPDVKILGPKLFEDMLERASQNAIPWNKIPGKLDKNNPDVQQWTDWKNKNLASLQEKSTQRVAANTEYKDFFDIKKRRAKLEAEQAKAEAAKALNPDEPPPLVEKDKKDEKDWQAEEAVSIVQDIIPTWPKAGQAAK